MLAEAENVGGWSKEQEVEKVNGTAARRMNGKPIMIKSLAPDRLLDPTQVADAEAMGVTVPLETQRLPQLQECLTELVRDLDNNCV